MENGFLSKLIAIRQATQIGCSGAHQNMHGEWIPCSSVKQYLSVTEPTSVKSRMRIDEMRERASRRKKKGRKRRDGWQKLRERRILGIGTLPGGGLVSYNGKPGPVVTSLGGGLIPGIFNGNPNPPNIPGGLSAKSAEANYSPRDNDDDVYSDIESARRRAQQIGCIGVSRRISKSGKTVWMPCTNMTDYNNLTGMTALGRLNQAKKTQKVIRTILKNETKKRKTSITEEILGKSIGPKLSGSARFTARTLTQRFDPNAEDGDGDGLLQDGTAFERPNMPTPKIPNPEIGKTNTEEKLTPASINAVKNWINKPGNFEKLSSEPIESFDIRRSTRGFASTTSPVQKEPVTIEGLKNPEASPTNPFRNLGGRKMGEIILGMVKPRNKNKKQRTTYLIGGTTGGGKSTVLDEHLVPKGLVPTREEAAHVDPDFVKLGLPGYNDGVGAPIVHDDSLRSSQKIMDSAREQGADIVATGAGSTRQRALINQARNNGDRVVAHWVHVSPEEASRRMKQREKETGRRIPDQSDHFARSIPKMVSSATANGEIDEFYIWDNEVEQGKPPRLIASFKDGKLEIHDQKKLDEFMNGNPLNPKPGSERTVSDEAREALKESDEFIGFASGGKKKPNSRYTPPKNKPTYPSGPSSVVPPPGIPGALPPPGIPGANPIPATPGRVGTSSPFGKDPGTGVVTSISSIEGIDEKIETAVVAFIEKLKDRISKKRDGTPKNALNYVLKKLDRVKTGIAYQRWQGIARQQGPRVPFDLSYFSLKGKLDNPVAIRRVVENFVPVRGVNETENEFIERLFATIPALRYSHISDMPDRVNYMKAIMKNIGYDARAQKDLRKLLEAEITSNKAFRELVEEFGLPVMFSGTGMFDGAPMDGTSAFHTPFSALIVVGKNHIAKGKHEAIGSTFYNKKFDTVQETIRHEWFHYLDAILMAADEATLDARLQTYEDGLRALVTDPEAVVRKITSSFDGKTLEEEFLNQMTSLFIEQNPNWSPEKAREEAIKFMKEQLQKNRDDFVSKIEILIGSLFSDNMIAEILRDRGGILDEVAKKYSEYARYGVHELIAEVGRMITSTATERSRPDNNIAEITEETVDLLVKLFPSISRAQWLNIIRLSNPELEIKVLAKL